MTYNINLSVIIPVYNVEKYLKQCLDSVLNQTLENIEIILIDDGSSDDSAAIIDEYAYRDKRITAIHKENGGYGKACNLGLEKANGEYIAILEPDDFIEPDMYKRLYELAKQYNSDIVKSSYYKKYETPEKTETVKIDWSKRFKLPDKPFKINEYPQFLALHPSIWSAIYKREFLNINNIRFIEAPGAGWTDNPFQIETMCLAENIYYTDKAFYHWRCRTIDDAQDIKDYTIPFKRCSEIHNWLKEKNITDKNILAAIYEKELSYINIILRIKDIPDMNDCIGRIKKSCTRMQPKIVYNSNIIRKQNKKLYYLCTHCIQILLLKRFKKKIISIKFNKNEKAIYLFGKRYGLNNRKKDKNESSSN